MAPRSRFFVDNRTMRESQNCETTLHLLHRGGVLFSSCSSSLRVKKEDNLSFSRSETSPRSTDAMWRQHDRISAPGTPLFVPVSSEVQHRLQRNPILYLMNLPTLLSLLLTAFTLFSFLLYPEEVEAFQAMIELPGGGKQCIGEQLSKHVLVVGEVHLLHPVPPPVPPAQAGRKMHIPLLVTALDSSSPTPIYKQQGKEHVRTAFTTTTAGTHSFCVHNLGAERIVIDIQMLWGPEARDYGQIAKAEHLDEIMLQLMRLQDRLKLYHANVLYMRQNEQKMRDDSDATASWLMTFCIINVLLLILTALASAYYFKRFFRSKKII